MAKAVAGLAGLAVALAFHAGGTLMLAIRTSFQRLHQTVSASATSIRQVSTDKLPILGLDRACRMGGELYRDRLSPHSSPRTSPEHVVHIQNVKPLGNIP